MMVSLCTIPTEVLHQIALSLLLSLPPGLPTPRDSLTSLLSTCRYLNNSLTSLNPHNSYLYASLFRAQFDTAAPLRRYGPRALRSSVLVAQLKRYYEALKILRAGDAYHAHLEYALEQAWMMTCEDDGLNRIMLQWAGMEEVVERFITVRMYECRNRDGWPIATKELSLTMWLLWATMTDGR